MFYCRVLLSRLSCFSFRLTPSGIVQLILRVPGVYVSTIRKCWVFGRESWRPLRESPGSWFGRSDLETRKTAYFVGQYVHSRLHCV